MCDGVWPERKILPVKHIREKLEKGRATDLITVVQEKEDLKKKIEEVYTQGKFRCQR